MPSRNPRRRSISKHKKKMTPEVKRLVTKHRSKSKKNFLQYLFFNHLKMRFPEKCFHYEYYFPNDYTFYLLDIAIPKLKVDIEVDGKHWHGGSKDEKRDEYLKTHGWKVIRVPAKFVLSIVRGEIEFNL